MSTLDLTETFRGKALLFVGATGFLGQVTLSMLLERYGEALDRIWVVVRRGSAPSAERRFQDKILPGEPFRPLREKYGEGTDAFLISKCSIIDGDITDPSLGLSDQHISALDGKIAAVINSAGLVSFNPSLELALDVNTAGARHAAELCLRWKTPLIHVSTAFVAGNRSGLVFEDESLDGYFPKKLGRGTQGSLDGRDFSLSTELSDCRRLVERLREKADDRVHTSTFREKALKRLEAEGRDTHDEKTLRLAIGRERKLWLSAELTRVGMERAQHWGWPNTYTYSKSLGEQVIAGTPGLQYAILRPSIVESALRYPFPGWNEGFTTSAPLAFACLKERARVPAGTQTILDMVPVDMVASAVIAATGRAIVSGGRHVYQLASGDKNPFYAARSVELVGLYRRRYFRQRTSGTRVMNDLLSRLEPQAISLSSYRTTSAPAWLEGAKRLKGVLREVKPQWGAPTVSAWMDRAIDKLDAVEEQAVGLTQLVDLFLPFIWTNRYVFRCDNTRALFAGLTEQDRQGIYWEPEKLDWRHYFLDVHLPGLEKWVFPGLEEATERRATRVVHRDLLELLDAAVHAHRHRVAFRRVVGDSGERAERFSYGEVQRYAARVGSFLLRCGVQPGDRVILISENRPEWGISFFGILRAGATAVPLSPELSETQVVELARHSGAKVCLITEGAATGMPELFSALGRAGVETQVQSLAQAMGGDDSFPDRVGPLKRSAPADAVAALIYGSGGFGGNGADPKGAMLTHRNFTAQVAKLASAFDLRVSDGVLSVLPLHHAFELSCGLLTPFSLGAAVTYLDELNADRLGEALESGRISTVVGTPALWNILHKKVTQELAARPGWVEEGVKALLAAHGELRDRTELNLGKLLFWPLRRKLGGQLRLMISDGAALSPEVAESFHAMGFDLTEGYGLTEAAPVLTVDPPSHRKPTGALGRPLPGIELRILDPDSDGVGEVLAKGPNVMAGYFQDEPATHAVLKGGWLHTGDRGRLDAEGRLRLAEPPKQKLGPGSAPDTPQEITLKISPGVARVGRALIGLGQRALYDRAFEVKVSGQSFIPQNRSFLVVSNHASHLDTGLVKHALGPQGVHLSGLAARDYFFDTPLKRAYFENFTQLIPIDRQGPLRDSLRQAGEALRQGKNVLIFPEGGRSPGGGLMEFKPTLGYLAPTHEVDVLPIYLKGTYEALPKGAFVPSPGPLEARLGPAFRAAELKDRTRGLSRSEGYRQVTLWVEEAVKALRDGRTWTLADAEPAGELSLSMPMTSEGRDA